jgi:signal transduction histidine kinase
MDPGEVCELYRKNRYDLILLDLVMPGTDGFQVMEALKEIETEGYLPVLALTAHPAHKVRALQSGAKDFISKPFDLPEVLMRVRNMLEVRLLHEAARIASNEQLRHANRLATVGQLAAGIAHELGSPLQVVAGRAKMIATGEAAEGAARESGRIILEQAQRMTQIIRGLLDFARRRPARRSVTNLQDVARETLTMLGPIAKKKSVALEIESGGPLTVQVDMVQTQQALTNLVMNAIQSVGERGHVTIAVSLQRVSPPADHGGPEAEYACLGVRDDGPGIKEQDRPRVFEPFFTTKDVGEGTGLGLAVADGLVRENGGWIAVESEVGRGACLSIFLPCSSEEARS